MWSGSAQLTGTVGNPLVKGNVSVIKGTFYDEPFDRLSAGIAYAGDAVEITSGQIAAGQKQVQLAATYRHAPGKFDIGRLQFRVDSNVMPLSDIATLQRERPGAMGSLQ